MLVGSLVDISIMQELCHKKNRSSFFLMLVQHLRTRLPFNYIVTASENTTYQLQFLVQNSKAITMAILTSARHARNCCIVEHWKFLQSSYAHVLQFKIFAVTSKSNHSFQQFKVVN